MKKNLYFVFIAASFALLASAPGRLAYGLPLIIELNLLAVGASAFNCAAKKLQLGELQDITTLAFTIFLTLLFKQLLILYSPVLALTLGFAIFLPAASAFLLGSVYSSQPHSIKANSARTAKFSVFALAFFLLRDFFGYGAVSLPAPNGIAEALVFDSQASSFLSFFATIPGSLFILVFCMSALLTLQTKMNILERAEAVDEDD